MTFVSVGTPSRTIKEIIDNYSEFQKLYEILPSDIRGKSKIFINGTWIGISQQPEIIIKSLINHRRKAIISKEISIVNNFMNKEIRIFIIFIILSK